MSEATLMHYVAASVCSSLGFGKYIALFNYHINEWWVATNQMVLSINDKEEETNWVEKVDFLYSFLRLRENSFLKSFRDISNMRYAISVALIS